MGWSIGYDSNWKRDIGYGVPATCDYPGCGKRIDRGLSFVCGGEPYGGNNGCGLYFCGEHGGGRLCERCEKAEETGEDVEPFDPTPDHPVWIKFKLRDKNWKEWRDEHPVEVDAMKKQLQKN